MDRSKCGRTSMGNGHHGFNAKSKSGKRLLEIMRDLEARCTLDIDAIVGARLRGLAISVLQIEKLTIAAARGDEIDDSALSSMLNQQSRLMNELGITE